MTTVWKAAIATELTTATHSPQLLRFIADALCNAASKGAAVPLVSMAGAAMVMPGRQEVPESKRWVCLGDFNWMLQTARLTVRPMQVADADFYHRVRGMMPFDPQSRSLDESRALVAAMVTRYRVDAEGWGQFAVIERASGAFIGDLGVNFDTPRARQAELGFAIDPAWRRAGIATEACAAMVEALFASGRTRVTALTDARNVSAQKLLERLHFRQEGRFIKSWQEGEAWFDELIYARLADE